jgi:esterase/lipase superfamily enzyme
LYVDPHLPRHIFGWYSPRLGLEMPIVAYGDRGHPLLIYPTAQADFLENERFWLIKSIEHLIFAGKVRVFSIDSINRFAWMNRNVSIPEAARRQALYSAYVEEEVVPHIRRVMNNPHARVGVTQLREECEIHIVTGQGAYEAPDCSRRLSDLLWTKGVHHTLDLWGHDVNHDWPWWRKMLPFYISEKVHW